MSVGKVFYVIAFCSFLLVGLSGCATTSRSTAYINHDILMNRIGDNPINVVPLTEGELFVQSASDSVLGAYLSRPVTGSATGGSSAKAREIRESMPSPSYLLARALRTRLIDRWGLNIQSVPKQTLPFSEHSTAISTNGGFIMRVYVDRQTMLRRPMLDSTYQYDISASAAIYDSTGSLIWRQSCATGGLVGESARQFKETGLIETDVENMLPVYRSAADLCAKQLVSRLFG